MKILQIITKSELGGAQTVVTQLSNKLSENHEVILVAGEGDGKIWDMVEKSVKCEHCPNLQRSISIKNDILASLDLRRIYKKYKPDVVHLHSTKAGILGRLVLPSNKIVYTVHGFDSIRLAFRKFLPVERLMQYFCRGVVGVSNYDRDNLISENITKNVTVVYNGISKPNVENISLIKEFKYDKVVLSIARVAKQKRADLFVQVARLLPDYGFIWIGNQSEITEFGKLPDNCHFIGNIPNAGAYCSKASLFMLASNYEGLPMVILEAMSFGKPIVASNVGGVSEIVRDNENGFVVENSAENFAAKIKYILENDDICYSFGEKSKEIYEQELTVDKMVNNYLRIYKNNIQKK